MIDDQPARRTTRRVRPARMGELVADALRDRILDGELRDGDLLPRQQALVEEFDVSHPSLREAMRILETEGLVSVRRGNVGGAVVHTPKAELAAYMLALVFRTRQARVSELAAAIREIEPLCAASAADNADRHEVLVPRLRELNSQMEHAIDDPDQFTAIGRQFHTTMVEGCGNSILTVLVGTLETLWAGYEQSWAEAVSSEGEYPEIRARNAVLKTHQKLTEFIDQGARTQAFELAVKHSDRAQMYVLAGGRDEVLRIPTIRRPEG